MGRIGYIALGTVMCLFGVVLGSIALASVAVLGEAAMVLVAFIAYVIAGIGSLMILVGIIATGVVVGMRDHAHNERRLYAEADARV
jgi:hypothetical protein